MNRKMLRITDLKRKIENLKRVGKTVVFTNGCFDILHYGHVKLLRDAKSLGDVLVVGLNSDSSVRRIKGKARPIRRQAERAAILAALETVDYVAIFNEPTPERLIRALAPDILVKGGDWHKGNIVGADFVASRGGKVVTVPLAKGYSTTSLIAKIRRLGNG